jgi:hypothetical protein
MANTQRLTALDASFLYYEKPNRRLHVGCVAMLDGTILNPSSKQWQSGSVPSLGTTSGPCDPS